jgi:hypothetical protein
MLCSVPACGIDVDVISQYMVYMVYMVYVVYVVYMVYNSVYYCMLYVYIHATYSSAARP